MAELTESNTIVPIRASSLLDLENRYLRPGGADAHHVPSAAYTKDLRAQSLDKRFAQLWSRGQVVGIGSVDEGEGATRGLTSLPLRIVAATLLNSNSVPLSVQTPTTYIIAPHATHTIPILHAHLAHVMSNSAAAIELLKPVRLLQYFDLAGLVESVAEVSEHVYQASQSQGVQPGQGTSISSAKSTILVQGIGPTASATHRRSGLVQANALLAGLLRNITQLSRSSNDVPVLLEIPVEIEAAPDWQLQDQDNTKMKALRSTELVSAFLGPTGETLRLSCGHETLSRTLEAGLDCVIVIHDGLGRTTDDDKRKGSRQQVVEVVKDKSGDLTGLWDIWKEA